ncbi:unnamed protein product, partial [Ectocarpus sp. 8 AP-2014]
KGLSAGDTPSIMDGDANSGAATPDEWGSAVASGDATKLAELVLVWSGSKPERALSVLRDCVSLLEKEVAFSAPAFPGVPSPPTSPAAKCFIKDAVKNTAAWDLLKQKDYLALQ